MQTAAKDAGAIAKACAQNESACLTLGINPSGKPPVRRYFVIFSQP